MLLGLGDDHILLPIIVHDRVGRKSDLALRCDDPATPVAEVIPIGIDPDGWAGNKVIRNEEVGNARKNGCVTSISWASAAGSRRLIHSQLGFS